MNFQLCEKRHAMIADIGHVLVTGGPGSGKTTVALLKAREHTVTLEAEQGVLFLSFSRAAVQQVRERMRGLLNRSERQLVEVSTYHLFCLRLLEAHGRLLNGRRPRIIYPMEERILKAEDPAGWPERSRRLALEEGVYTFDMFAPMAATLLERSRSVSSLITSRYPLLILDEFQDTNDDQWRLVQALAGKSVTVCLADPDQRIFGYQGNIDPRRMEILRVKLSPTVYDLNEDNHRSPNSDILQFANAVLQNRPLPKSKSVHVVHSNPKGQAWAITPQAAVRWLFGQLRAGGISDPSVAVLARTNGCIALLSAVFQRENEREGKPVPPVSHQVMWDAELATAAGQAVASVMEWPGRPWREGAADSMRAVALYFRLKNADSPSKGATQKMADFETAALSVIRSGKLPKKAPRLLAAAAEQQPLFTGSPLDDWRLARGTFGEIGLDEIVVASRMLRLFRATDMLASGLMELWLRQGSYAGAASWLKRALDRERLVESETPTRGCILMNMHKSKGKEFDAVLIVEQSSYAPLIATKPGQEQESRRLLRVAITRARHRVIITRPAGCAPLTTGT